MAEPGGICISGTVHDAIGRDLASGFEFIGEQAVKNLLKPVRAYRHMNAPGLAPERPVPPATNRRSKEPSLAVKPFENLSGDPDQDLFANALTNGILTALTRVPGLTLVQDESPFLARSGQMSEQEIVRQFGVQHLLKGDLRKFGDRFRLNVVLLKASTGRYLWAEKFDRNLSDYDDLFSLQDEITEQIVASLDVRLLGGEAVRIVRKMFTNPAALDSYFRGEHLMWNAKSSLELRNAQHLLEEAIRLEPTCSAGYAAAAIAYWVEGLSGQGERVAQVMDRAQWHAREAIRIGDVTGYPRLVLAQLHLSRREFEEASREAEHAISARPSCPAAYTLKAGVLNYLGRPGEAIEHAEFALRLTPVHPVPMYPAILASALYGDGRHEEAVTAAKSAIEMDERNVDPYLVLAESSIALGRSEDARRAAGTVKRLQPDFTLAKFAGSQPYEDQRQLDRLLDQLRQAGLE
jgi:adenylate cyclase